MGAVPTAVTVITAMSRDEPLSVDPPLMLVALDRRSRTLGALQEAKRFGVSVLSASQAELALRFSTKDPHPVKWGGVAWRELGDVPALDGACLAMACELCDELDGGDHAILTGAVTELESADLEPLVFHEGSYRGLAARAQGPQRQQEDDQR
jgi:flavin reductase (DIM6/NTAB) family NADH-FMN oxidoreductase RutF